MESNYQQAFAELEMGVHAALETYSNVHRGSGHFSMVTTRLFEKAREIVLDHSGLDKRRHVVIFCTPLREKTIRSLLKGNACTSLSSEEIGLPLGIRALVAEKKALPKGIPFQSGGGNTKLVSPGWVIWAEAPDRFEAGTPAVINVIAFAKALLLMKKYGKNVFRGGTVGSMTAEEILGADEWPDLKGHELLKKLRETMIGRNVTVPAITGPVSYVNLDNAASTPALLPAWEAYRKALRLPPPARTEIVSRVRAVCAELLGAPPDEYDLVFTSNTTEGINLAAGIMGRESPEQEESVTVNTLLEHNSNDLPWRSVANSSIIRLPVDDDGFINTGELERVLSDHNRDGKHGPRRVRLVAVSGASNVLGTFNDLEEISTIVHEYGANLLVDAAQLVAHRKVGMKATGIDCLSFCAHKAYAPFGAGVLVMRKGLMKISGDELRMISSSGEENSSGIAALGKALLLLQRVGFDCISEEEESLTRKALVRMSGIPGVRIYGVKDPGSPRIHRKGPVIPFFVKGRMPYVVARELAGQGGIGIRNGCHCAHLLVKHLLRVPPSLEKFQWIIAHIMPGVVFPGLARISMGLGNTTEDIDRLTLILQRFSGSGRNPDDQDVKSVPASDMKKLMKDFTESAVRRVYFT
jgi:selenocysteine lyase/cysteine desulfurase